MIGLTKTEDLCVEIKWASTGSLESIRVSASRIFLAILLALLFRGLL